MLVCVLPSISIRSFFSVAVSSYRFGRKGYQYILISIEWLPEMILVLFRFLAVLVLLWLTACLEVVGCRPGQICDLSIQSFSSLVRTSINSILCSSFDPLVTTMMSSNHAGCLLSSVWSIFSWKTVGISAKP